jgi:hypothetical protein
MRHETLQSVHSRFGTRILECVLDLFRGLAHLVNLHFIFGVRLIHMTKNEVHSSLYIVVALSEASARLSFCQSHACDHHDPLFTGLEPLFTAIPCTLFFYFQRLVADRVFDIFIKPSNGEVGALVTRVVYRMLRGVWGNSHITEHLYDLGVQLWFFKFVI